MQAFTRLNRIQPTDERLGIGREHRLVVNDEGLLWVYGSNSRGQLGNADLRWIDELTQVNLPPLNQAKAGDLHSVLLDVDGQVWVSGSNSRSQLGLDGGDRHAFTKLSLSERVVQVYTDSQLTMLVTVSGQLWLTSGYYTGFTHIALPEPVAKVGTAFRQNRFCISASGRLWVKGLEIKHGFGVSNQVHESDSFTLVELPEPIRHFAQNGRNTAYITESGRLWVKGSNVFGQLGLGDKADRQHFTEVPLTECAAHVLLCGDYMVVLAESGQLWVSGQPRANRQYSELVRIALTEPVTALVYKTPGVFMLTKDSSRPVIWSG